MTDEKKQRPIRSVLSQIFKNIESVSASRLRSRFLQPTLFSYEWMSRCRKWMEGAETVTAMLPQNKEAAALTKKKKKSQFCQALVQWAAACLQKVGSFLSHAIRHTEVWVTVHFVLITETSRVPPSPWVRHTFSSAAEDFPKSSSFLRFFFFLFLFQTLQIRWGPESRFCFLLNGRRTQL